MCGAEGTTKEHTGFWVHDDGDTFVVVRTPDGYSGEIGRRFKQKPVDCLNCSD
jgi:hypothetical protein